MEWKEVVTRRTDGSYRRTSGSGIDRRDFLALTGGATAVLTGGISSTTAAAQTQDTTVESGYGAGGYGELSYGGV